MSLKFNLELEEVESLTEELGPWRQNLFLPLHIKISFNKSQNTSTNPQTFLPTEEKVLLEKWKIVLEPYTTR
jgi:hypothetical protein